MTIFRRSIGCGLDGGGCVCEGLGVWGVLLAINIYEKQIIFVLNLSLFEFEFYISSFIFQVPRWNPGISLSTKQNTK